VADPSAGAAKEKYIIRPSDMLTVSVWKQPSLSGALLVRPDGKISMPLLGDIEASGTTPMQLSAQISNKLQKFVRDPEVSVVVSQIHKSFVYVLGEVGKRGPVQMTPGMTILQAISSAGGLTEFAKKKKIYILRGKGQRIPVNYKKALKGDANFNLTLLPGDTIVVP
jgi:polysaccharide export outer membrane protein